MALAYDIQQQDNDLVMASGDFLTDTSDEQHIEDIIVASQGSYKEFPTVGVGIEQYIHAALNPQDLERVLKIQLKADGYKVGNPRVYFDNSSKLIIKPDSIRE